MKTEVIQNRRIQGTMSVVEGKLKVHLKCLNLKHAAAQALNQRQGWKLSL